MVLRQLVLGVALSLTAVSIGAGGGLAEVTQQAGSISPDVAKLSEAMQIGGVMQAMRDEGLAYAKSLEDQMFPGKGGAQWLTVVGLIYDPAVMRQGFEAALNAELAADTASLAKMQSFFGSELGQRILSLELASRHALMDDAAKEAAKVTVEDLKGSGDPRMAALEQFEATNELIESNVAGAMNANLAFFQGMAAAGGFAQDMTEDDMLSEVWAQEADVRAQTSEWLYSYMVLAYQPLSDDDLAAYQAFSETAEGQKLNRAAFVAFDKIFTKISRDLGRAAAKQMQGQDI